MINGRSLIGVMIMVGACRALLLAVAPVMAADMRVELWSGIKDAAIKTDKAADGGRCVVANAEQPNGAVFVASTPELRAGVYEAVLHMKLSTNNNINTAPLRWTVSVGGAGAGGRSFDIRMIERSRVYQDIPCQFSVRRSGRATVSLAWKRCPYGKDGSGVRVQAETSDLPTVNDQPTTAEEKQTLPGMDLELDAEPPIETVRHLYMAVDRVSITPISDVDVSRLEVDKIRYRPADTATICVAICNYALTERSLQMETDFVREMDDVTPVDRRTLRVGAGVEQKLELRGPPFKDEWGYEVRCRVLENGKLLAEKSEYFTVHSNMWAVAISGSRPKQFTGNITRERAIASAGENKRNYSNWAESGFWAPDEFGDFTPDTEYWWSGQGCYYGSVTGTRMMIEEGHKAGISYAVYANIWGGDGPPAFEMARAHPDWAHASVFNVEWFERWNRNPQGKSQAAGLSVWPRTVVHWDSSSVFEHHARELIEAHRTLGWDAVRYDSHPPISSQDTARIMGIVKKVVWAEEPDFQFGYNSSVPDFPPDKAGPFQAHCERGSLIMEEAIRGFWKGGTYEGWAHRLLAMKEKTRKYGGHFIAIGLDRSYSNDMIYQDIFWLAGNTHNAYDSPDVSVANYYQFATRYAGILWDLRTTSVTNMRQWLDLGDAEKLLWMPDRHVQQRDLGGGRRQFIVHLINAPVEKVLYTYADCKLPPPRENLCLSVNLQGGSKVRGVWLLTPEPRLTQKKLDAAIRGGKVSFSVPRLRFWDVVVVDLDNAEEFN